MAAPQPLNPRFEQRSLVMLHHRELLLAHAAPRNQPVVGYSGAALSDRSHRQLRLERNSQLAYDDHIQWRVQRGCDLVCHRHTTIATTASDQERAGTH